MNKNNGNNIFLMIYIILYGFSVALTVLAVYINFLIGVFCGLLPVMFTLFAIITSLPTKNTSKVIKHKALKHKLSGAK